MKSLLAICLIFTSILACAGEVPATSAVKGKVLEVDAKAATIGLIEGVTGILRASELSSESVEDARTKLKEGDEIEAKIINIDRKNRTIVLSIKAQDVQDEQDALRELNSSGNEGGSKLGDFLKGKFGGDSNDSEE